MNSELNLVFNKLTFKHYAKHLIIFIISFLMIIGSILVVTINEVTSNSVKMIHSAIDSSQSFDIESICELTDCVEIKSELPGFYGMVFKIDKGSLKETVHKKICGNIIYKFKSSSLDTDLNLIVRHDMYMLKVKINTSHMFTSIFLYFLAIVGIFTILFTYSYFKNSLAEARSNLIIAENKDSNMRDSYMNTLTEGLKHEINTPIAIIEGQFTYLKENFSGTQMTTCKVNNMIKSFSLINIAIEDVKAVLARLNSLKEVNNYANKGVKLPIYKNIDLGFYAFQVINRTNFNYKLDESLWEYRLESLSDPELRSILNHCSKNSLEAKSTVINVKVAKHEDGILTITFSDNGYGVRDSSTGLILKKSNYDMIFQPKASSKDKDGDTIITDNKFIGLLNKIKKTLSPSKDITFSRGIGLYVSRQIIEDSGGKFILHSTTKKGSIFEIKLPVIKLSKEDRDVFK